MYAKPAPGYRSAVTQGSLSLLATLSGVQPPFVMGNGRRQGPRRSGGFPDVITIAVRWYLRYGMSDRDVEELLANAGSRWTT